MLLSRRARPPSSAGWTSCPACSSQGSKAPIVAGSSWIPGRETIASARTGGSASFRLANETFAASRVGSSSRIVAERFSDSSARAPAVTLKFVISSPRSSPRLASFANTVRVEAMNPARSPGFSPRRASETIAVPRPASSP